MRNFLTILFLLPSAWVHAAPPAIAIRDVTVLDVTTGSLRADQTILIAGNYITAVGPTDEVRIPAAADVVEAAGRYVIPGLWDMHVHSLTNVAVDHTNRSIASQDWHFPLFLAYGVTGVRNMNDFTGDLTLELSKAIRRQLADGSRPGPPQIPHRGTFGRRRSSPWGQHQGCRAHRGGGSGGSGTAGLE
jgi:hypothetical protein